MSLSYNESGFELAFSRRNVDHRKEYCQPIKDSMYRVYSLDIQTWVIITRREPFYGDFKNSSFVCRFIEDDWKQRTNYYPKGNFALLYFTIVGRKKKHSSRKSKAVQYTSES